MWAQFPSGVNNMSMEGLAFSPEFVDPDGNKFFRIPAAFADRLRGLKGFSVLANAPEGAPENLETEPSNLSPTVFSNNADPSLVATLQRSLGERNSEVASLTARLRGVETERNDFKLKFEVADQENSMLRERLQEFEDAQATAQAVSERKAGRKLS